MAQRQSTCSKAGDYVKHSEGAAFIAGGVAYGWQERHHESQCERVRHRQPGATSRPNAISDGCEGRLRVERRRRHIRPNAAGQFTS